MNQGTSEMYHPRTVASYYFQGNDLRTFGTTIFGAPFSISTYV